MMIPLILALVAAGPYTPAERIPDLRGISNVGRVAPGIYRGSTPTDEGLDTLKKMGIRTIVNLRHYHGSAESRACRKRGFNYVGIRLESSDAPSETDVRKFLAVMTDTSRHPVYFHCWRGKDRTGAMCAVYRMDIQRWPLKAALAEMDAYGFYKGWKDLREFVMGYSLKRSRP